MLTLGCERSKTDSTAGDGGGTSDSSTSTGSGSSGSVAATGSSAGSTTGAPDCDALDYDALAAICYAAADGETCESSIPEAYPCAHCVWADFVPTTRDPDGTCHFGPVSGSCRFENLAWGDGCDESIVECLPPFLLAVYQETPEGDIELSVTRGCRGYYGSNGGTCGVDAEGNPVGSSPPECACLC
ncbi:MAG: hypothetical protein D6705_07055, partial [Deltaproteobacteria bacterium]